MEMYNQRLLEKPCKIFKEAEPISKYIIIFRNIFSIASLKAQPHKVVFKFWP